MENTNKIPATLESVWEILIENARQMEKSRIEYDRRNAETDRQIIELKDGIKEVNQMIGGMGNSNGSESILTNATNKCTSAKPPHCKNIKRNE